MVLVFRGSAIPTIPARFRYFQILYPRYQRYPGILIFQCPPYRLNQVFSDIILAIPAIQKRENCKKKTGPFSLGIFHAHYPGTASARASRKYGRKACYSRCTAMRKRTNRQDAAGQPLPPHPVPNAHYFRSSPLLIYTRQSLTEICLVLDEWRPRACQKQPKMCRC